MKIDINQKKLSFSAEYNIYLNGQKQYYAVKKIFSFLAEIRLQNLETDAPGFLINKRWTWFNTSYDIENSMGEVFQLRTVSYWKRHYRCLVGADEYEIFGHRGRKYSIYKNGIQVAWWDKESVTWFEGDNYAIIANDDCNIELLICFCLIMDNQKSRNQDSTVTFNLGWIGPEARPFDDSWRPTVS